MEKNWTSLKCKTSWSFNNPMRYVFTLAIIVFSFCVFYLTTFQGPANLFHLLRERTMCWAQKQLPLSGGGRLQKQSNTRGNSPGETAASPTVDTAVSAALSNHTATAGGTKTQKKPIVKIYQCNSNCRETDESPTRNKKKNQFCFSKADVKACGGAFKFYITIFKPNKAS